MKKHLSCILLAAVSLILASCKKSEAPPPTTAPAAAAKDPAAPATPRPATLAFAGGRKTSFQEVTSLLDPGGSLYLYVATDQWLAGLSTNITRLREGLLSLPGPFAQNADAIEHAFDMISRLVARSGVEDITGVGISGAPIDVGLNRNKFILHHAPGADRGFAWSIFGRAPHPLKSQEMLPTNTALCNFFDLNVTELWQVIERELTQSGIEAAAAAAGSFPQMFEKQTQIPWAPLLSSLAGEIGIILTLDEGQKVSIPIGNNPLIIPQPGLLIAIKVNNDLLYQKISARLQAIPKAVVAEEAGLKTCSVSLEGIAPFPLQPTVASSGDYFYFASSLDLVKEVQAVRTGKRPGLKASPEFQRLSRHLPSEGNQFTYVAPSFGVTIAEIQRQIMQAANVPDEPVMLLQTLLGGKEANFSLAVGSHTPNGWQTTSVGNQDSATSVILLPAVAASAIAAGAVLPALAKAKSKAQAITSVNQVKQLGLAARIYANEHAEKFPKSESWCDDIKDSVGSSKVFKAANDPGPGRCSFAFNEKLSGLDIGKCDPQTVLFFEATGDWNTSGGPELLIPQPRSGNVYVIGFADGSVQQVQPARIALLRWDP